MHAALVRFSIFAHDVLKQWSSPGLAYIYFLYRFHKTQNSGNVFSELFELGIRNFELR